jgi:hypothetical protein
VDEGGDSGTWTVFSVRDVFSGEVHVVGVVPGDQTGAAVCPSGDVLVPEMRVVVASSAWEAAGLIAFSSDAPDEWLRPRRRQ